MCIAFLCIIIVVVTYILNREAYHYIEQINDDSVTIHTRLLEKLNNKVHKLILVSRPVKELKMSFSYYAMHVSIICVTDDCNILISTGNFGNLYARRATKRLDQWEIDGDYGGPSKEVAEYPVRKDVTLMEILRAFIMIMNSKFDALHNNCHHMTCEIIKKFCVFNEYDYALYCPSGWTLISTCLFGNL